MKIKDIETLVVNAEMRNWVFVRFKTIIDWKRSKTNKTKFSNND